MSDDGDAVLSPEAFVARWLRPERPQLARALAALSGMDERELAAWIDAGGATNVVRDVLRDELREQFELQPESARERLVAHGLLSSAWLGDAQRGFLVTTAADEVVVAAPARIEAALVFAADPAGVAAAEALAREAAARLAPWGRVVPQRIRWCCLPDDALHARRYNYSEPVRAGQVNDAELALAARAQLDRESWECTSPLAIDAALGGSSVEFLPDDDDEAIFDLRVCDSFATRAAVEFSASQRWAIAAQRDHWFVPTPGAPDELSRRGSWSFRSLPDPFAPRVALWMLGYGLASVDDDAITLIAPTP